MNRAVDNKDEWSSGMKSLDKEGELEKGDKRGDSSRYVCPVYTMKQVSPLIILSIDGKGDLSKL